MCGRGRGRGGGTTWSNGRQPGSKLTSAQPQRCEAAAVVYNFIHCPGLCCHVCLPSRFTPRVHSSSLPYRYTCRSLFRFLVVPRLYRYTCSSLLRFLVPSLYRYTCSSMFRLSFVPSLYQCSTIYTVHCSGFCVVPRLYQYFCSFLLY